MYTVPFQIETPSYPEALLALKNSLRFGIQPMLESVEEMLDVLERPDATFTSIQIAGTNGKTSTARYTAHILRGEGYKVGLYTSPELVEYTERMEIDGKPVARTQFARGIAAAIEAGKRVNAAREQAELRPYDITEFDLLTVACAVVFAEANIQVAVLECGMGGRWDATSAISSIKHVGITGIGLDHTHILGDTLEQIAAEKSAIIKPGRTCTLGVGTATPTSVEDVFLNDCASAGVEPVLVRPANLADAAGEMHPGVPASHPELGQVSYTISHRPQFLGDTLLMDVQTPHATYKLLGAIKPAYQAANIACALSLCEQFMGHVVSEEMLMDWLPSCPTPGRFDVVRPKPLALIDACHNPQSVQTFLSAVHAMEPDVERRPVLLCAVLADKDVAGIVKLLAPEFGEVVVTQTSSPRALDADVLATHFAASGNLPIKVCDTVAVALEYLRDTAFVACGSITLAGEVAALMRK